MKINLGFMGNKKYTIISLIKCNKSIEHVDDQSQQYIVVYRDEHGHEKCVEKCVEVSDLYIYENLSV